MKEPSYFTHEEYELTKVALAHEEVPADALTLLSAWIEGERLLVDDRKDCHLSVKKYHFPDNLPCCQAFSANPLSYIMWRGIVSSSFSVLHHCSLSDSITLSPRYLGNVPGNA
jgi:hypothetical protein